MPAPLRRARSRAGEGRGDQATRADTDQAGRQARLRPRVGPGARGAVGGIPPASHWGKELTYDSLAEFDRNLNIRPALAEKFERTRRRSA